MFGQLLTKVSARQNDRELKRLRPRVAESTPSNPRSRRSATTSCAARPRSSATRLANGETLDDLLPEAFAVVREAGRRVLQHAALRRAADRRHGAAQRHDRRDEDRRRQDARRHAARLSQRARGQGRSRRHRQRLPRPPRLGVDGPRLPLPRHDGRRHPARPQRPAAPGRLRLRHHLRHQQRVRLRLPARQHEVRPRRRWCSAAITSRSSTKSTAS